MSGLQEDYGVVYEKTHVIKSAMPPAYWFITMLRECFGGPTGGEFWIEAGAPFAVPASGHILLRNKLDPNRWIRFYESSALVFSFQSSDVGPPDPSNWQATAGWPAGSTGLIEAWRLSNGGDNTDSLSNIKANLARYTSGLQWGVFSGTFCVEYPDAMLIAMKCNLANNSLPNTRWIRALMVGRIFTPLNLSDEQYWNGASNDLTSPQDPLLGSTSYNGGFNGEGYLLGPPMYVRSAFHPAAPGRWFGNQSPSRFRSGINTWTGLQINSFMDIERDYVNTTSAIVKNHLKDRMIPHFFDSVGDSGISLTFSSRYLRAHENEFDVDITSTISSNATSSKQAWKFYGATHDKFNNTYYSGPRSAYSNFTMSNTCVLWAKTQNTLTTT